MLCMIIGTAVPGWPAERGEENMKLFAQWRPPAGLNIKAMYFSVGHAFILADVETSAACYETLEAWVGSYQFQVIPVVEAGEMMMASQKVVDWRKKALGG